MLPQKFDIDYCWRAFLRRKWYVVVPFCLIFTAGVIYALTRPKIYRASALILVQQRAGARAYVRSNISGNIQERIAAIKAKITSNKNLETIVAKHQFYTEEDHSKPEKNIKEKIALLASNISFEIPRVGKSFRISCTDSDPKKAMEVANKLAGDFVVEQMRTKEEETVGATQFLESELQRVEALLHEKEKALSTYKQQHMGSLPEQLTSSLLKQGQIQERIESIERNLNEAKAQKIILQGQLMALKSSRGSNTVGGIDSIEAIPGSDNSPQLIELKRNLEDLRLRYTENHPDIVRLKRRIARLEEQQQPSMNEEQVPLQDDISLIGGDLFDAQLGPLQMQLATINQTIKDLQAQKRELEKDDNRLNESINEAPQIRLDLIDLERDYNAIKQQYSSLLAKKLDSETVYNLEKQEEGAEFKVINWAPQPSRPISPNIPRLILMAAVAGLAAGFGLGFVVEYVDQTFRDYKDLGEFLQQPVLAVIPQLEVTTGADDGRKRFMLVALCVTGVILAVIGIGIWLWMNGNLQELVEKIRTATAWMNGKVHALVEKIFAITGT